MFKNADGETYLETVGDLREYLDGLPGEAPIRTENFSEIKIVDRGDGVLVIN